MAARVASDPAIGDTAGSAHHSHSSIAWTALGVGWEARIEPARLGAHVRELFAAFAPGGTATHLAELVQPARGDAELHIDGEQVDRAPEPEELLDDLVRYVDHHTSRDAPQLLMHGGAVELDGVAVVLPGSSGAGKSTLTAGLVSAGFRYLSDEIVAVARDTRRVEPYPRPLMLRAPSVELLPAARRLGVRVTGEATGERWLVPPAALGAVGQPCAIACIALLRFESRAPTRLEPISRAAALYELCGQTLEFDRDSRAALDLLEAIVRDADCYRLVMGDLDSAVAVISGLVGHRVAST